jgi:hypothetical protein
VRGVVTVRGKVSAPLTVARVELLVGRSLADSRSFTAATTADFALTWDATRASLGQTSLRVVACGQGVGGLLVQGSSTVSVEVAGGLPSTQVSVPPSTTTTVRATSTSSSSSVPSSSTSSTATTSTTTTLPGVTTTQGPPGRVPEELAGPQGRLLPLPAEKHRHRPRPLWVGAVMGLAGLGGLALSRVLRVRASADA